MKLAPDLKKKRDRTNSGRKTHPKPGKISEIIQLAAYDKNISSLLFSDVFSQN